MAAQEYLFTDACYALRFVGVTPAEVESENAHAIIQQKWDEYFADPTYSDVLGPDTVQVLLARGDVEGAHRRECNEALFEHSRLHGRFDIDRMFATIAHPNFLGWFKEWCSDAEESRLNITDILSQINPPLNVLSNHLIG